MKLAFSLTVLLLGASLLSAEPYEMIELTNLYKDSVNHKKGASFKPWKINNENEILGIVRTELPPVKGRRATKWAIAFGAIQNDELKLITHETGVIRRLFINDQGDIVGSDESSKWPFFFWHPLTKTFRKMSQFHCGYGSDLVGLDEQGHALLHCRANDKKITSYLWSLGKNKLKEIGPPLFQLINDHGVLFYTTPTTEEGRSNITMKGLKDEVGVTHASLPMELIPIRANTWSHLLFYGSQLRKGPFYLILWSPKDSKTLTNVHHFSSPPLLNNKNEVIYHDGKEYKFYEEGNEISLSELIDIDFLTVLNVLDFNDEGALLVRGHVPGLKQPEYYLLTPPIDEMGATYEDITQDDPDPTDDDWDRDFQDFQQGDSK